MDELRARADVSDLSAASQLAKRCELDEATQILRTLAAAGRGTPIG